MRKLHRMCRAVLIAFLIAGLIGCSAPNGTIGSGSAGGAGSAKTAGGLRQAQKAVADKNFAEAIKLCDAVIAADPDNAEAYKLRGLARMSIPYVPRPAPPPPKWTDTRPRHAPEPEWLGRLPALKDLIKAGELRDHKDPVVWYLRSVFHTTEAQIRKGQVQEIRQATEALQEAEKLDPGQPAYRRAREMLVPQMYFAKRDAYQDRSPYTGQYADVIALGDKEPYGEVMKRYGWKPGTAWTYPEAKQAPRSSSASGAYDPDDVNTYILLGIGTLFVLGALGSRDGSSGAGGAGGASRAACFSCGGTGVVRHWNHVTGAIETYRCSPCASR